VRDEFDEGYHTWGFNIPNYASLPASEECASDFTAFTQMLTHEQIETLTDPGGFGFGDLGSWTHEVGDLCEPSETNDPVTVWGPGGPDAFGRLDSLARYWSNSDNDCQPRLDAPGGSQATTWILGQGSPLHHFASGPDSFSLNVPTTRVDTTSLATQVAVVIQTGSDDLQGGSSADVTLTFNGGTTTTTGINAGNHWDNGETHSVLLTLPAGVKVSDLSGITISTNNSGDDWNVDKVGLVVSFANTVTPMVPPHPIVHKWLDASELPLARLTGGPNGSTLTLPVESPATDDGVGVTALNLVISVGSDNLNGGGNAGDNCDVSFMSTPAIATLTNVNGGGTWDGWTIHTVPVPIPPGLLGGHVGSVTLSTNFTNGDNWNIERVQLLATMDPVSLIQITINQPAWEQYDHSTSLTLDYSATDVGGPGIASVVGNIDGSTTVAGQTVASGLTIPLLTALSLGKHSFSVLATDAWGNSKTSPRSPSRSSPP
jgi:hypothetical protein